MDEKPPQLDAQRYAGQWIALDPVTHEVLAAASSLGEAESRAKDRGITKPLLVPVPKSDSFFVGVA